MECCVGEGWSHEWTFLIGGTSEPYKAFVEDRLDKFSTNRLLNFLKQIPRDSIDLDKLPLTHGSEFTALDYKNKLKEILATREHILTKREAKNLRQNKKKK